jgi:hypothetical protein
VALQRRARAAAEPVKIGELDTWRPTSAAGCRIATARGPDRQPSPSTRARTAVTADTTAARVTSGPLSSQSRTS